MHIEPKVESRDISYVAVLTNPKAGKGRAAEASIAARKRFIDLGINVVSLEGSSPEASAALAREALKNPGVDALVVCGGDGLINLALQAQANSRTPLGIIPAGTGNDHAREYHIPLDPERAADVIAEGFCTTTDLVKMTTDDGYERYFGTIATQGFDSLVTRRTNTIRWPKGPARYLLSIGIELLNLRPIPCTITLDDSKTLTDPVVLCAVGNTKSYGGGMKICPRAQHNDGVIDLTVVPYMPRRSLLAKMKMLYSGSLTEKSGIAQYRAKKIRIDIKHMPVYADGDLFRHLPITYEIASDQGLYLVPHP